MLTATAMDKVGQVNEKLGESSAVFHPDILARGGKMVYAINKGG